MQMPAGNLPGSMEPGQTPGRVRLWTVAKGLLWARHLQGIAEPWATGRSQSCNKRKLWQPKNQRTALLDVLRLELARGAVSSRRRALHHEIRQHLPDTKGGQEAPSRVKAKVNTHPCAQEASAHCSSPGNLFPLLLLSHECHGRSLAFEKQLRCQKLEAHFLFLQALETKSHVCLHFLAASWSGAFSDFA